MSTVPLATRLVRRLIERGTWVNRADLADLTTCAPALDDALADLVVLGQIEHRQHVGYRFAASEVQRRAAQGLLQQRREHKGLKAWLQMDMREDGLHVGVARFNAAGWPSGIVVCEVLVPPERVRGNTVDDELANLLAISDRFFKGAWDGGTSV